MNDNIEQRLGCNLLLLFENSTFGIIMSWSGRVSILPVIGWSGSRSGEMDSLRSTTRSSTVVTRPFHLSPVNNNNKTNTTTTNNNNNDRDWQESNASHSRSAGRQRLFLYLRISVAIQRFNAVCLTNSLTVS